MIAWPPPAVCGRWRREEGGGLAERTFGAATDGTVAVPSNFPTGPRRGEGPSRSPASRISDRSWRLLQAWQASRMRKSRGAGGVADCPVRHGVTAIAGGLAHSLALGVVAKKIRRTRWSHRVGVGWGR